LALERISNGLVSRSKVPSAITGVNDVLEILGETL